MDSVDMNQSKALVNGFRKCGIEPLNKNTVSSRIPGGNQQVSEMVQEGVSDKVGSVVIDYLSTMRYNPDDDGPKRKRRKVTIPAGESITEEDLQNVMTSNQENQKISKKRESSNKRSGPEPKRKNLGTKTDPSKDYGFSFHCEPGCHVIVEYEGEYFPGKIVRVDGQKSLVEVEVMVMQGLNWSWPDKIDKQWYGADSIIGALKEPQLVKSKEGGRPNFRVPEIKKLRKRLL
ncbi:hypothetical protein QAD02_000015 [Eretmocerus hayati]|uniref:Uncharacterized protein n=1 Tax=Eretmocerus hayati TaxID=131215 RepID=A0ACC2NDP2_9HYME|nr:hypothetical protein QAD02_000015 [Eretmocerus hayati]